MKFEFSLGRTFFLELIKHIADSFADLLIGLTSVLIRISFEVELQKAMRKLLINR